MNARDRLSLLLAEWGPILAGFLAAAAMVVLPLLFWILTNPLPLY